MRKRRNIFKEKKMNVHICIFMLKPCKLTTCMCTYLCFQRGKSLYLCRWMDMHKSIEKRVYTLAEAFLEKKKGWKEKQQRHCPKVARFPDRIPCKLLPKCLHLDRIFLNQLRIKLAWGQDSSSLNSKHRYAWKMYSSKEGKFSSMGWTVVGNFIS